jgi:Tfp pilus tip-associated adhesin PilY1
VTDANLVDVTDDVTIPVADGENGWKINLVEPGNNWRGEKVLAESVTVNGVIFFPTFTPTGANPDNPCLASTLNRTWAVYLDSGMPFGLRDSQDPDSGNGGGANGDPSDRYSDDKQGGIAPALRSCRPKARRFASRAWPLTSASTSAMSREPSGSVVNE